MGNLNMPSSSDSETLLTDRFGVKGHLFVLLLSSLLLKLFIFIQNEVITNDGPRYINQALQFLHGSFSAPISQDITFLYSLAIAGLGFFFPDLVLAGQLLSLAASVLTIIPLYLLFRGIWSEHVAFFGSALYVVLPCFNEYAVEVMRDPVFLFVFSWMLLFAWRALDGKLLNILVFLLLVAVGPFLRLESLVFLPFFLVFSLCILFNHRRRWAFCLTGFLAMFFVLFFYSFSLGDVPNRLAYLKHIFDGLQDFKLWQYSPEIKKALSAAGEEIPTYGNENSLLKIVSGNIRMVYLFGLILMFIKQITWPGLFLLCFGFSRTNRPSSRGILYLAGISITYLVMAFDLNLRVGFMNERYLYIPVLVSLPWMGAGLHRLLPGKSGGFKAFVGISMILFMLLFPLGRTIKASLVAQPVSAKLAGQWLRQNMELAEVPLIANERKIPFYARKGGNFINLEFVSEVELLRQTSQPGEKLVSYFTRIKSQDEVPALPGYKVVAEFTDEKYVSLLYHKKE